MLQTLCCTWIKVFLHMASHWTALLITAQTFLWVRRTNFTLYCSLIFFPCSDTNKVTTYIPISPLMCLLKIILSAYNVIPEKNLNWRRKKFVFLMTWPCKHHFSSFCINTNDAIEATGSENSWHVFNLKELKQVLFFFEWFRKSFRKSRSFLLAFLMKK